MPERGIRVTVEDLETGERRVREVAAGDYILVTAAPCRLDSTQAYPVKGTVVLTVKDWHPVRQPAEEKPDA